ncbi:MAG: hypothetical protein ACYDHY_19485 [Acidiferrobacterales bacterium]
MCKCENRACARHNKQPAPENTAGHATGGESGITQIGLDQRELATTLAALRLWQSTVERSGTGEYDDIATDFSTIEPLDAAEIDTLCERINCS